jgi:hypothetical protein
MDPITQVRLMFHEVANHVIWLREMVLKRPER